MLFFKLSNIIIIILIIILLLLLLSLQYVDKFEMDVNMNEILVNDCTDGLKVTNQQPYQRDKNNLKHKT